jgi:hypothetical protein
VTPVPAFLHTLSCPTSDVWLAGAAEAVVQSEAIMIKAMSTEIVFFIVDFPQWKQINSSNPDSLSNYLTKMQTSQFHYKQICSKFNRFG